jgi:hypothetical protein
LLHLVHLNNGYRKLSDLDSTEAFTEGDVAVTNMEITKMSQTVSGLQIGVVGQLKKKNSEHAAALIEVRSEFLFRGNELHVLDGKTGQQESAVAASGQEELTFEKTKDAYTLVLKSKEELSILQAKDWIQWRSDADKQNLRLGERLVFRFASLEIERASAVAEPAKTSADEDEDEHDRRLKKKALSVKVEGVVYKISGPSSFVPTLASLERGDELERQMMDVVATIAYQKQNVNGNVPKSFVQRFDKPPL